MASLDIAPWAAFGTHTIRSCRARCACFSVRADASGDSRQRRAQKINVGRFQRFLTFSTNDECHGVRLDLVRRADLRQTRIILPQQIEQLLGVLTGFRAAAGLREDLLQLIQHGIALVVADAVLLKCGRYVIGQARAGFLQGRALFERLIDLLTQ